MEYDELLARPWQQLTAEQQAASLQNAYIAGTKIGSARVENGDTTETNLDDYVLHLLMDDKFNETDEPNFQNDWKPSYWDNSPNDLRVTVFVFACEAVKELERAAQNA